MRKTRGATHVVLPDSQVKPGTPTEHLNWIGRYIVDQFAGRENVKVIHLGDHWHMDSLSSYEKGKKSMEGRRIQLDIDAGNAAFDILCKPLEDYNAERKAWKEKQWWPERHFLLGNHEDRISRAVENDATLEGFLSLDLLNAKDHGWQVHPFLDPVEIDGVSYCHYFYNPNTGKPYGGLADTRLKNIGHSFVMGHQQGLQMAMRSFLGQRQRAIVAGSCYLHDETYRGPQANDEWRGILVLHEVEDGDYDAMEVSLNYLSWRYTGKPVSEWMVGVVA